VESEDNQQGDNSFNALQNRLFLVSSLSCKTSNDFAQQAPRLYLHKFMRRVKCE